MHYWTIIARIRFGHGKASWRAAECILRSHCKLLKQHEFLLRNDGVVGSNPIGGTIFPTIENWSER